MPFRFENFELLSIWFSQTELAECTEELFCDVHGSKVWFHDIFIEDISDFGRLSTP